MLGCLCQIGFFVLAMAGAIAMNNQTSKLVYLSWGVTQWIALIPLIQSQRAKGHNATVQGLLIMGSIGVLLSSACAAMMLTRFVVSRSAGVK
ncbi:MAG TPA: hypothetical protein VKG25_00330 [Bryobacteraceae bacterium]|nr:hypothetical protein [Bryobacteraceae bacterium]